MVTERGMWKALRVALNNKKHGHIPNELTPDKLNTFFTNIGKQLADKFTNGEYEWLLPESIYTFNFTDVDADQVYNLLLSLSETPSLDILTMDSKLIRLGSKVLSTSLCKLFNMSMNKGVIPVDLKLARVTPVYKNKGMQNDCSNYRPISCIPHIAKVFERLVQNQLKHYLVEHDFITCDQSAYRKNHSTETSLHKVIMQLLENANDGLLSGACFFDLQKCFDTIDHKILLTKI